MEPNKDGTVTVSIEEGKEAPKPIERGGEPQYVTIEQLQEI